MSHNPTTACLRTTGVISLYSTSRRYYGPQLWMVLQLRQGFQLSWHFAAGVSFQRHWNHSCVRCLIFLSVVTFFSHFVFTILRDGGGLSYESIADVRLEPSLSGQVCTNSGTPRTGSISLRPPVYEVLTQGLELRLNLYLADPPLVSLCSFST